MSTIACPECAAEITLEAGTEVGEIIVCSDCGVDLEITALEPAAVQLAPICHCEALLLFARSNLLVT